MSQYDLYKQSNEATSVGLRLEFGESRCNSSRMRRCRHGTGSTRALFQEAAAGQTGAAGEVIGNPHNQDIERCRPVGRAGHSWCFMPCGWSSIAISRQRFGKLHRTAGSDSKCYELIFQLASVELPTRVMYVLG